MSAVRRSTGWPGAPRTLRTRFAAVMAGLLLVTCCGQLALVAYFWSTAAEEQIQSLNWGLAHEIAEQLAPHVLPDGTIDVLEAQKTVQGFQRLNGSISVYILDGAGRIVFDFSDGSGAARDAVDLGRVTAQLGDSKHVDFPYRGTDPARPTGEVAFLAAPFKLGSTPAFIYVTLFNTQSGFLDTLFLQRMSFRYVAFGTALIICSSIFLSALAARLITARFSSITGVLERYTGGERDARILDERNDEVGAVASAFNTMAAAIESQVTELERKDTLRRELIMNVWHDLRSPLAVIAAQIQVLEMNEQSYDSEKRLSSYSRIERSSEVLNKLLSELRDLSRLETKETVPALERCNPCLLLDDTVALYRARAEAAGITLSSCGTRALPDVLCDPHLISRVLSNLVDNALRYTSHGGAIELTLERGAGAVQFSIADTGTGIPGAALGRIFERHFQLTEDDPERAGASGLGLAIVKQIIESHGGRITASSREGEGTIFSFTLPLAEDRAAEEGRPPEAAA